MPLVVAEVESGDGKHKMIEVSKHHSGRALRSHETSGLMLRMLALAQTMILVALLLALTVYSGA